MISVIVPVYNAEGRLPRLYACLLAQTYRDFELLLVDDGSTDGSGILCDDLAKSDPRVTVVHKVNGGAGEARNVGLDYTNGAYVAFLDADDEVPPNYLEALLRALTKENADLAVCDLLFQKSDGTSLRFSCERPLMTGLDATALMLCRRGINSGPCAKLFTREAIADRRFPHLRAYEDIVFCAEVLGAAKKVTATSDTCYRYLDNPSGTMASQFKAPSTDVVTALSRLLDYIDAHRDALGDEPFYATVSHLMSYLVPLGLGERYAASRDFLRKGADLLAAHRGELRRNPFFSRRERLFFLLASHRLLVKGRRFRRL